MCRYHGYKRTKISSLNFPTTVDSNLYQSYKVICNILKMYTLFKHPVDRFWWEMLVPHSGLWSLEDSSTLVWGLNRVEAILYSRHEPNPLALAPTLWNCERSAATLQLSLHSPFLVHDHSSPLCSYSSSSSFSPFLVITLTSLHLHRH